MRRSPHAAQSARRRIARASLLAALSIAAFACDRSQPPLDSAPPPAPESSRWVESADGRVTGVQPADVDALDAAVARARASLGDAQVRFAGADPEARDRWAVLWRADAGDGGIEYLWIRPVTWSPHRVEGRLASAPIAPALAPMEPGQIVAFPSEEIVDWLYERADGTTDGGFTRAALGSSP